MPIEVLHTMKRVLRNSIALTHFFHCVAFMFSIPIHLMEHIVLIVCTEHKGKLVWILLEQSYMPCFGLGFATTSFHAIHIALRTHVHTRCDTSLKWTLWQLDQVRSYIVIVSRVVLRFPCEYCVFRIFYNNRLQNKIKLLHVARINMCNSNYVLCSLFSPLIRCFIVAGRFRTLFSLNNLYSVYAVYMTYSDHNIFFNNS